MEGTLKVTVPFAVPLAPLVNVSHAVLLAAVHAQPVAAVTATLPVTAVAATLADGADRVGVHVAPAWVTVNVLPPIVRVPVRAVPSGLAATV